jgi:O-antigen/teichoic acid export membrane protein
VTSQLSQTATPQARLQDRVLKAGSWTLAGYGVNLCGRLLSNLILTRLLFPEAFGAIAAAMALISGLVLISDFGVSVVIVQSPRGDQVGFLRSAWVFQLWRCAVLWVILAGVCAVLNLSAIRNLLPAGSVFADPSFAPVTVVLGLSIVLGGAESTAVFLNIRRLNYSPIVILDLAGRLFMLPFVIVWAWIAPSVWALVGGVLIGSALRVILSHTLVPGPRMGLNWEKDHLQEIVRFGRWIAVSSFATFIAQQSDVILLGVLMPGSMLGLYSVAKMLVDAGEGLLERLNGALSLPVLGEVIRKDPSNLRDRYYRFRLPIELTAGLLGGGLFASGHFVVNFLYDARYAQAGDMLPILALGTVIFPFLIIRSAFTATGDAHITAAVSVLQAVSLVVCMAIGFFAFGLMGVVAGVALHRIIPSAIIIALARRRDWISIRQELRIIPAFVVGILLGKAVVMMAAALGLHNIHQFLHSSK